MGSLKRKLVFFLLLSGLLTGCAIEQTRPVPVQDRADVCSTYAAYEQWQSIFKSLASNNLKLQKQVIQQLQDSKTPCDAIKLALIYEFGDDSVRNPKKARTLINKYSNRRDEISDYDRFAVLVINSKQEDSASIGKLNEKIKALINAQQKDAVTIKELNAKIDALKNIESSMSDRPQK